MAADADGQVVLLDERILELTDAALPAQQLLPRAIGIGCQRGRHRDAGDDHIGESGPRSEPCESSHYCSDGSSRSVTAKRQGDIVTTEAERIVDGVLVFAITRLARNDIEIDLGI